MSEESLTIVAKRDGFRRCGVAHTTAPKIWPADAFTREQWERIAGDPMLVVTDGVVPGAEPAIPNAAQDTAATFEQRLRDAIGALGEGDFGGDGKPKVEAIRANMALNEKESVTAKERDRIWALILKEREERGVASGADQS